MCRYRNIEGRITMDSSNSLGITQPVSMSRYVVISAIAFAAAMLVMWALIYLIDFDLGNSAGYITTFVSIACGIMAFGRKEKRPMLSSERLWFSLGMVLINFLAPLLLILVMLLLYDLPVSIAGADMLFGGGGSLTAGAFLGIGGFMLVLTFLEAYFFAWLLSRKFGTT